MIIKAEEAKYERKRLTKNNIRDIISWCSEQARGPYGGTENLKIN